ncbi:MAG: PilZ domain-containing protein [Nitrospira sp.]|nr:MAG: PilZ domain-containing protein [Nitrospira sp.]
MVEEAQFTLQVKTSKPSDQTPVKPLPEDRRVQPRFTTQFRSTFSGQKQEGQGRTLDISIGGCKIESDMKVEQGAKFECRLHIPGLDWPLRIDEATVRWVDGNSFGIAFSRISPEELAKLKTILSELEQDE